MAFAGTYRGVRDRECYVCGKVATNDDVIPICSPGCVQSPPSLPGARAIAPRVTAPSPPPASEGCTGEFLPGHVSDGHARWCGHRFKRDAPLCKKHGCTAAVCHC